MDIKEKAEQLLQECETVILSSINEEGYPRPVVLSKTHSEELTTCWMATGCDSRKVKDFRSNPKAGLCFYHHGDSVSLTGTVEIVTDAATKQAMWQDWFIDHFSQGATDPNYCLLKFKAEYGTFWIDQEFIHCPVQ